MKLCLTLILAQATLVVLTYAPFIQGGADECRSGSFICDDGSCIPSTWKCDGYSHCPDGSDEQNCAHSMQDAGQFTCRDGTVIPLSLKCNGKHDCADASDESNCGCSNAGLNPDSSDGPISRDLFRAICLVQSGGNVDSVGERGKAIGPYHITKPYWIDAMEYDPSLTDHGDSYESCKGPGSIAYSERVMQAYMQRYATVARLGHPPTDENIARIHNGGPNGWKNPNTVPYWERVQRYLLRVYTSLTDAGQFTCGDGTVIPLSLKCNGKHDCADASDESNCGCSNAGLNPDSSDGCVSGPISRDLFRAICLVESGGNVDAIGDRGKSIGPYQISRPYWIDAMEYDPSLTDHGDSYDSCKGSGSIAYSERVMQAYMQRYATVARLGHPPTDENIARIHNGGPNGWKNPNTVPYWERVQRYLLRVYTGYWPGTQGIDVSMPVTVSQFQCLKNEGFDFVIVRAYRSTGQPDTNAVQTIANARAAGFWSVDVYMFPCPTCSKTAREQVNEMYNSLGNSNFGQVWLDIEGQQYWSWDTSTNQQFFKELLSAANAIRGSPGVYTNQYQWSTIMGSSYSGGSSYDLWYAHYESTPNPSFSDYKPFGGWNYPAVKQYSDRYTGSCSGVQSDLNWKP